MKIFLSWSGDLSRELAEALRDWLPAVLQSVKPFFTPNDIEKGARWSKDISQELEASAFGIFCLTKENLTRPWIMFEAGALSKRVDASRVCPVLFGIESTDLEGPLVQFQAAAFSEAEIRKLIRTMNAGLNDQKLDDAVLNSVFEMWWPRLNDKIGKILERHATRPATETSVRSDRDILDELLQLSRLSASSTPKSRTLDRVDPGAMLFALEQIIKLIEQVENEDYDSMTATIKGVFDPLRYVISKAVFSAKYERELEEAVKRVEAALEKAT
jgi:hypothetical protein